MKNKAVLIFGTFNPITNAHLELGIQCKSLIPNADIYYVPSNLNYMKNWKNVDVNLLKDGERIGLIKDVVSPFEFNVSDIEILKIVNGNTYETVSYFKELGYEEVYICLGYDKLSELHLWYKSEELVSQNNFLVFKRENKGIEDCECPLILQYKDKFIEVGGNSKYQGISSTIVRNAYYERKLDDVKDYIPNVVYEYLSRK